MGANLTALGLPWIGAESPTAPGGLYKTYGGGLQAPRERVRKGDGLGQIREFD